MNRTLEIIRTGHPWLCLAAHVEGLPDLWTPEGFPFSAATTGYAAHRAILAIKELAPIQGSGDPFRGLGDPAQVTIQLHDLTGYVTGLYQSGTQTTLAAAVESGDTTISLTDASSFPTSGAGYIQREYITWTGKSGSDLTGVTRAVRSLRAAGDYPLSPTGDLPPYRVGLTPMWLDGRIITIYAVPTTRAGQPLTTWAEAAVIWRGVITAAPYSLTGVDWQIQAQGLERLLQGSAALGTTRATLIGAVPYEQMQYISPVYVTDTANTLAYDLYIDDEIIGTYEHTMPTGWLSSKTWRDFADGVIANASSAGIVDTANAPLVPFRIGIEAIFSVDVISRSSSYSLWPQLLRTAGDINDLPTGEWATHAYYIPASAPTIPIITQGPLDWPTTGTVRVRDEIVRYGGWEFVQDVGQGKLLYLLTDCQRGQYGTIATDYYADDPGAEGPEVTPGVLLLGDSSVDASTTIIGDLPAMGSNLVRTSPEVLGGTVLPAGPRFSLLPAGARLSDAIGDALSLDSCQIAGGIDDTGDYRLLITRPGNAYGAPRTIDIDWDGQTQVRSGLGQSVTTAIVTLEDGSRVTTHDLPTLLAVGTVQSREFAGHIQPSIQGLEQAGFAGYAMLRKWGRPGLILDCELGPEYRDLRVGEAVSVTLPDGIERQFAVMRCQPSWAGSQPHCRVTLWQSHTLDTVWYAPAALIEDQTDELLTCTASGPNYSPWRPGEEALDIEWFQAGDTVRFLDPVNDSDGVSSYEIVAIDLDAGTVELDGDPGDVIGHYMIHDTYAGATAASQGWYAWIAASGTEYHQWGG